MTHLVQTVECPPTSRARNICEQRCNVTSDKVRPDCQCYFSPIMLSPVEPPQTVSNVDSPSDVPSYLPPGPSLRVDCQWVGGEVGLARPGVEAKHHHVLADHVEGNDDSLANKTSAAPTSQSLEARVVDPIDVEEVPHSLVGGDVAHSGHDLAIVPHHRCMITDYQPGNMISRTHGTGLGNLPSSKFVCKHRMFLCIVHSDSEPGIGDINTWLGGW